MHKTWWIINSLSSATVGIVTNIYLLKPSSFNMLRQLTLTKFLCQSTLDFQFLPEPSACWPLIRWFENGGWDRNLFQLSSHAVFVFLWYVRKERRKSSCSDKAMQWFILCCKSREERLWSSRKVKPIKLWVKKIWSDAQVCIVGAASCTVNLTSYSACTGSLQWWLNA